MRKKKLGTTGPHRSGRKAVVYVRQSGPAGQGSIEHRRLQRRHAERLGWPSESSELFEDQGPGRPGSRGQLPGYARLLASIEKGKVGAIFISDMTRLGRDAVELQRLFERCRQHDVLIVVGGSVLDPSNISSCGSETTSR